MAMVKSAARMRLALSGPDSFFADMNAVLAPISAPNKFATVAFLSFDAPTMSFGTAAHLPMLQYRAGSKTVEERWQSNLPIAMVSPAAYTMSAVSCEPRDVFAILTDGLTEVTDDSERELGLESLKAVLAENAAAPLQSIAGAFRARALTHGPQRDDQTVFLARRVA